MSITLTFRTSGAWGAGLGSNLSADQVDLNFWNLAQAIEAIQNDPPTPITISSVTVAGTSMTFVMSDASTIGPIPLPVLKFRYLGAWQPSFSYAVLDTFFVNGYGIFTTQIAHTSGTTFDPDIEVSESPALLQLFGATGFTTEAALESLSDVDIGSSLADGDFFVYDGGTTERWVNRTAAEVSGGIAENIALGSLSNVSVGGVTDGQVLSWNGTHWIPSTPSVGGGAGATALAGLTDVEISSSLANGQVLTWNEGAERWEPQTPSVGGGGGDGGGASALAGLTDVDIDSSLAIGQVLTWNGEHWIGQGPSGGGGGGSSRDLSPLLSVLPTQSGTGLSTWFHQNSATATDTTVGVLLEGTNADENNLSGLIKSAPSTPYTITALVALNGVMSEAPPIYNSAGIGFSSSGGSAQTISLAYNVTDAVFEAHVEEWTSGSAYDTLSASVALQGLPSPVWLQISDDGTNVSFNISLDGEKFVSLYSAAKSGAFLSGAYTNVGFFLKSADTTTMKGTKISSDVNGNDLASNEPGNGATALAGLSDVEISSALVDGQVLTWNESDERWIPQTPSESGEGGGATALAGLTDVDIDSSLSDGDLLVYDGTSSKWRPVAPNSSAFPGGSGGGISFNYRGDWNSTDTYSAGDVAEFAPDSAGNKAYLCYAPVSDSGISLALDGSAQTDAANGDTLTFDLTTENANDLIIVVISAENASGGSVSSFVTAITDNGSAGISFTKRIESSGKNTSGALGPGASSSEEIWYGVATSPLTSENITVTFGTTFDCAACVAFGVVGANVLSPFDANGSVPVFESSGASVTISTDNANDFLIGVVSGGSTGGAVASGPDGWTQIGSTINLAFEGGLTFAVFYDVISSAVAGETYTFGQNVDYYSILTADAIQSASAANPSPNTDPLHWIG